jgi:transposase
MTSNDATRKEEMGSGWARIDLTDSGLRVKTRKEAHMKTQLSKPARSKASYTEEYKKEALELWRASGRSAAKVAAELGIRPPLLYRRAQLERESKSATSEHKSGRSVAELEAAIRRLRAENAKLLEQREVLKNLWASSPKCRPEVCPNRADERPTQSCLAVRGAPGLTQRLLRLD